MTDRDHHPAKRPFHDEDHKDHDDQLVSWHLSDDQDHETRDIMDGTVGVDVDEEEVYVDGAVFESFDSKLNDTDDVDASNFRDRDAHMDSWLHGIGEEEMRRAQEAHGKRMQVERQEMELDVAVKTLLALFGDTNNQDLSVSDLIRLNGRDKTVISDITDCCVAIINNGIYEVYEFTVTDLQDLYNALME